MPNLLLRTTKFQVHKSALTLSKSLTGETFTRDRICSAPHRRMEDRLGVIVVLVVVQRFIPLLSKWLYIACMSSARYIHTTVIANQSQCFDHDVRIAMKDIARSQSAQRPCSNHTRMLRRRRIRRPFSPWLQQAVCPSVTHRHILYLFAESSPVIRL